VSNWDQSRFDSVLTEYVKVTSRTFAQACNTKAFYVARRALYYTPKTSKETIQAELRKGVKVTTPKGLVREVPLAALILNARAEEGGGLQGGEMRKAVRKLELARLRSIAYLKSGWIPAIRHLADKASRESPPPTDRAARQFGSNKGYAKPAVASLTSTFAQIVNSAQAKHTHKKDALERIGARGLERGFQDEAASMEEYLEKKAAIDAAKANAALAAAEAF